MLTMLYGWLRRLFTQPVRTAKPDTMSLHDWADLPPHHPDCDGAPC